ncbi:ferritin [Pseudochryseolinea flava]|uniref:Ferritin n=1 Tax=Pseudochryseolinea flava TaxID=2059302 RepID=A0A364XYT1_9BACT|nr:ferritin [Pseudochryseolinea flava]RAV98953.1 ferritin [Pseudochryseolinea flava]
METSVIRLRTSLQDSVLELLNQQIAMEAHSSATYLSMAGWCYSQGLNGCGDFFKKQSAEEREHMLKIFDFVVDAGGLPISPEVAKVPKNFEGLRDVLVQSLEQEISITRSFNNISDHCLKVKDFQTQRFLHWFLDEQLEEESQARRCIELYDLIGLDNGGLYKIDKEIIKLKASE